MLENLKQKWYNYHKIILPDMPAEDAELLYISELEISMNYDKKVTNYSILNLICFIGLLISSLMLPYKTNNIWQTITAILSIIFFSIAWITLSSRIFIETKNQILHEKIAQTITKSFPFLKKQKSAHDNESPLELFKDNYQFVTSFYPINIYFRALMLLICYFPFFLLCFFLQGFEPPLNLSKVNPIQWFVLGLVICVIFLIKVSLLKFIKRHTH